MAEREVQELGEDKSLLLVDDDEPFLRRLARAMEKRGFEPELAGSVAGGKAIATARPPAYAVVDLRLEDGNGLDVVEVLREKRPDSRVVVLTGYGAIATAVAAVKIGATDYLSKPADAQRNAEALDVIRDQGRDAQAVFISIDPERDTPEVVGEYASYMHEDMIALTGSLEQVKAASKAYRTYYKKQPAEDEFYLVDHSTLTYLVLPEAGFVEFFKREDTAEKIANSGKTR